jgi:hypothetical protein
LDYKKLCAGATGPSCAATRRMERHGQLERPEHVQTGRRSHCSGATCLIEKS